jgi:hypothetical protein
VAKFGRGEALYYAGTRRTLAVREPPPEPLSEADLSLIWQGQRFPPGALQTGDGQPVEVLYPGRAAGGPGPDYRDSVVVVRGERRLGDVELHVRASAFHQHGHHADPAYNRLALHVVFLDDAGTDTPLASGARVPVAAFAPWVERRSADVASWLARPRLWQDPCRSAGQRLGEDAIRRELIAAGRERLRERASRIAAEAREHGLEEALWRALIEALGFGGDRAAFLTLAALLPLVRLRQIAATAPAARRGPILEAALLAVAGLAPAPPQLAEKLPPALPTAIGGGSRRPANRPERRLAGAASLLARAENDLLSYARRTTETAGKPADLLASWSLGPAAGGREALIGRDRAIELLLNAVLPAVSLLPDMEEQALSLAASLPAPPPYGKTRFLETNLAASLATPGEGRRPRRFVRTALEQQGLLAFQANWCSQGGCGRCPFS